MNGTITFESQNHESLSKLIYTNNQKLSFGLSVSAYSQIDTGQGWGRDLTSASANFGLDVVEAATYPR